MPRPQRRWPAKIEQGRSRERAREMRQGLMMRGCVTSWGSWMNYMLGVEGMEFHRGRYRDAYGKRFCKVSLAERAEERFVRR